MEFSTPFSSTLITSLSRSNVKVTGAFLPRVTGIWLSFLRCENSAISLSRYKFKIVVDFVNIHTYYQQSIRSLKMRNIIYVYHIQLLNWLYMKNIDFFISIFLHLTALTNFEFFNRNLQPGPKQSWSHGWRLLKV